jgi:predicted ATP-dependent protease
MNERYQGTAASYAVLPEQLYKPCDPAMFSFETTASVEALPVLLGHARAAGAMRLSIELDRPGYNLFVMGPPGSGKRTMVSDLLTQRVSGAPRATDWAYVNNFSEPHKPLALTLPAGKGAQLRDDMKQLIDELQMAIPAVFESDEYRARAGQLEAEFTERHDKAFTELGEEAASQSIGLLRTPAGFSFAPLKDGEVISAEDYAKLPDTEKQRIQALIEALQRKLEAIIRKMLDWRREWRNRLKQLNRDMTLFAVGHLVAELKERYAAWPPVVTYFEAVEHDVIENADDFRGQAQASAVPGPVQAETPSFHRYQVNLMVDHSGPDGTPVVFEDHPTYQNLIGRVEHLSQFGTLMTDFTLIKPGALHRANGGYLVLDALKLLTQPYAWEGLKRALRTSEIRIESLAEMYSLLSTVSLAPEPIALRTKVILLGDRQLYYLLMAYDPDFAKLFKIVADFDDGFDRTPENTHTLARLLATVGRRDNLLPLDRSAVARVIEHGARTAGDAKKITANVQSLFDLMCEADHHARSAGGTSMSAADVNHAIVARRERADRLHQRLHEDILRGTLLIATAGEQVGQVNALSVFELGGYAFAEPTRITATTHLGDGHVIDVQREVELGGAIHSKGVLILSSFLAARFSQNQPHSLAASLVFEQTYGVVDGDSASLGELCALLSSLADVPIKQSLAITGSVNQLGEVQPIGAVNEKIEGFFQICKARGLSGTQGVLIPRSNIDHLMLDAEVTEAVRAGRFAVYAVRTVDEAVTLLTGMPAGEADATGHFAPDTFNGRVAHRLRALSALRSQLALAQKHRGVPAKQKP